MAMYGAQLYAGVMTEMRLSVDIIQLKRADSSVGDRKWSTSVGLIAAGFDVNSTLDRDVGMSRVLARAISRKRMKPARPAG
jgi:hypothetical protein